MKKIALTMVILLGMGFGANAQQNWANGTDWTLRLLFNEDETEEEFSATYGFGGGLFGRGENSTGGGTGFRTSNTPFLGLPSSHGNDDDAAAPLGGGALLLIGFGAAYAGLRRKNQKD